MGADPQPAFHIFLSYRREGTSGHAGRLYDDLLRGVADEPGFAEDQVFMDIDTIAPGDDFREVIAEAVARCDVLLAVIGKRWATVKDTKRRRRLDNPADFVRLEIEAALKRKIPVVPVLVDNAAMPNESELPASLANLAYRNAVELSDTRWNHDVGRLLASLSERERASAAQKPQRAKKPRTRTPKATPSSTAAKPSPRKRPRATTSRETSSLVLGLQASLGLRETFEVWNEFVKSHQVGDTLEGPISKLTENYGRVALTSEVWGNLPGTLRLDGNRHGLEINYQEGDVVRVRIEEMPTDASRLLSPAAQYPDITLSVLEVLAAQGDSETEVGEER